MEKNQSIEIIMYILAVSSYLALIYKIIIEKEKSGMDLATWSIMALLDSLVAHNLYSHGEKDIRLVMIFACCAIILSIIMFMAGSKWIMTKYHYSGTIILIIGLVSDDFFRESIIGSYLGIIGVAVLMYPQMKEWVYNPNKNPLFAWWISIGVAVLSLYTSKNLEFEHNIQAYALLIGDIICLLLPLVSKIFFKNKRNRKKLNIPL